MWWENRWSGSGRKWRRSECDVGTMKIKGKGMDKSFSELSVYQSNKQNGMEVASGRVSTLLLFFTILVSQSFYLDCWGPCSKPINPEGQTHLVLHTLSSALSCLMKMKRFGYASTRQTGQIARWPFPTWLQSQLSLPKDKARRVPAYLLTLQPQVDKETRLSDKWFVTRNAKLEQTPKDIFPTGSEPILPTKSFCSRHDISNISSYHCCHWHLPECFTRLRCCHYRYLKHLPEHLNCLPSTATMPVSPVHQISSPEKFSDHQ